MTKSITKLFKTLLLWSVTVGLLGLCAAAGSFIFLAHRSYIDFSALEQRAQKKPSIVLDDQGSELFRFQLDKRGHLPIEKIPQHLVHAFLAAEDHKFFSHFGLSIRGIIRSVVINIIKRKRAQGASTITQQLVKLLFFSSRKTFSRKIKEQFLAIVVEKRYTKEQILEAYLNNICFGRGIYGVQAASMRFWRKPATDLTIAQAATLASIIPLPTRYCPLDYPETCIKRRNIVLTAMHKQGYINKEIYEHALNEPLAIAQQNTTLFAPHIREYIRQKVEEITGIHDLYSAGLEIKTTINKTAQKSAEKNFKTTIEKLKIIEEEIDGALIALDQSNGEIRALIGGANFSTSKFNRALQAKRQMASTFKPLIYASALMNNNRNFIEREIDEPIALGDWNPRNVTNTFQGPMTLAHALIHSNNIVAVKTLLATGIENVIALAQKCHVPGPLPACPALALGCAESTVIDSAALYGIFANKGIYHKPHILEWIKNPLGKKLYKYKHHSEQVIPWHISSQVAQVLVQAMENHKRRMPKLWINGPSLGKTGTANDARTCWFIGSTPQLTTAIYLGCDNNISLKNRVYSVRHGLPLWLSFNNELDGALQPQKNANFSFDPRLKKIRIDSKTGTILSPERTTWFTRTILVSPEVYAQYT